MYDENAPALVANGYHPHPVSPPGFEPAKVPVRFVPELGKFVLLKGWTTAPVLTSRQPGANIGVRCGSGLINFDYDDDDAALKISEAFESSPVCKAGKRAFAPFYRADFPVPSEDFYDNDGRLVLQILSDGKQCVIPPSIHPETKEPYRWTNGHSLYDTRVSELPPLPQDYRERLKRLGYVPSRKPKKPETVNPETGENKDGDGDDRFSEIKQAALKNLAAWVPDLGLYGLKRNPGRGASFRSVASFRPSKTGRPNEQRDLNLNIHPRGITDEGDNGKGYSAIDLVMVCRSCSNWEALVWLEEKLCGKKEELEIDIQACIEAQDAPKIAPEDGDDTGGADTKTENPDDVWVGKEWEDGDPIPAPLPMLIPYFVPLEPYLGYLWGQSQTYKTFLLNTMAVAVASRGLFAGQQVRERGLVYQVELEGSRSQLRIQAAKQFAGIKDKLPIVHVTKTPPSLIGAGKRVSNDWKKWAGAIVRKARAAAERWGVSLKLITIDPQNHFAGFTDEQSSAEGNVVCNALIAMAKEAGCPVLVADHLGKDPAAGGRGTSVKHQSPWFILDAGESAEELGEDRILIIRKMKDGEDGLGISFHMEKYPTKIEQLVRGEDGSFRAETAAHDTLVVVFEGEVRPVNTINSTPSNPLTDKEQIVLNQVIRMTNTEGQELPEEANAPAGLRGVLISRLQVRITRNTSFAGKGRGTALFQRTLDSLMAKKKIDSFDGLAWVPIAD
jgi:AAA domain/Bifunctional DNA primase/polymerase, N-terminal